MGNQPLPNSAGAGFEPEDSTKRYRGVIDLTVTNNSPTLKCFVYSSAAGPTAPGGSSEVGCSGGYFGEALKKVGHEVWGIE